MRYLYITVMLTALMVTLVPIEAKAQGPQGSGSPYSAYGLGDLMGTTQVSQALMGGVGVGLIDPYSVILSNPASYVSLRLPVFETGLVARTLRYETENAKALGGRTDILGLTLGVPVGKGNILQGPSQPANRWGFALGVAPVSTVGYQIEQTVPHPDGTSDVRFQYSGEGGLNRAFLGLALTVWQSNDTINKGSRIAVGADLNYLFGNIEETRKAYYPSGANNYNSSISTRLIIRSPAATTGIQLSGELMSQARADSIRVRKIMRYEERDASELAAWTAKGLDPEDRKARKMPTRPNEPLRYTLGASAELPASLAAKRTELINSFAISSAGVEFPFDTAMYQDGADGSVDLPLLLGAGFSIYNSRWTISAEHRRRDWSQYVVRVGDQQYTSGLATHAVYALGASFTPAGERRGTLFQRSTYRAGLRYSQDYRIVSNTQLQEIGMGFGIAVPVMQNATRSRLTFGVELGERGTTSNGLLRERFANVFVGVTITPDVREQWFKKRRLE